MTNFITKFNDHFMDEFSDTFNEKFSDQSPRIQSRRQRVLNKHLKGLSQTEIAEIESVNRSTISRDIKAIKQEIKTINYQDIAEQSIKNLIQLRKDILQTAESAPSHHSHKFYKLAKEIDEFILDQPTNTPNNNLQNQYLVDQMKVIIDWITQQFGPECLTDLIKQLEFHQTLHPPPK